MAEEDKTDEGTDYETEAKAMGWIPSDQFKGDPDRFISAEDYIKRGKDFIPILRANNKKLETELGSVKGEVQQLKTLLKAGQEAIAELTAHNTKATLEAARRQKTELKGAIREAEREGNDAQVTALEEQLEEVDTTITEATSKVSSKGTRTEDPPPKDADFEAWKAENPWYGTDRERTSIANAMATTLRGEGETSIGRVFLAKVEERLKKFYKDSGDDARSRPSRVGEGSRSNGGDTGNNKSYASLPPEAKAACDRSALKVVGEGRAYKTTAEWRKKYVQDYYAE